MIDEQYQRGGPSAVSYTEGVLLITHRAAAVG
jgi:hypothetical protein